MAIRLSLPTEPYDIDLGLGVTVTVRPLTTALYQSAEYSARRRLDGLVQSIEAIEAVGGKVDDRLDLQDPAGREGTFMYLKAQEMAKLAITHWEGVVGQEDAPEPVSPEAVERLMAINNMAEAFMAGYTAQIGDLYVEGKPLPGEPNGTLAPPGEATAPDVPQPLEKTPTPIPDASAAPSK